MDVFNAIWDKFGGLITFFAYGYAIFVGLLCVAAIVFVIFFIRQWRDTSKGFDSNFFKKRRGGH